MEYSVFDLNQLSTLRDRWYLLKDPGLEGFKLDPDLHAYQTIIFLTSDKVVRRGFVIPTIDFSKYNIDNLKQELFVVEMQYPQSPYNAIKDNVFFELSEIFAYQYMDQFGRVLPIIRG